MRPLLVLVLTGGHPVRSRNREPEGEPRIVIAHHEPHAREVQQSLQTLAGVRTNANRVATVNHLVAAGVIEGSQGGLERGEVGMGIGDDANGDHPGVRPDSHGRTSQVWLTGGALRTKAGADLKRGHGITRRVR